MWILLTVWSWLPIRHLGSYIVASARSEAMEYNG